MINFVSPLVGCSPGQYGGKQYTEYTDLDSGEILEQVVPRCVDCPFGQYASDKLLTECQQCPENHGTLSKGSTSQEKCIGMNSAVDLNSVLK